MSVHWSDEMKRELLAAQIQQLERRLKDVERDTTRIDEARKKNKGSFDRTHRLQPKKIDEGDWVLVYGSSLDNQHRTSQKFARRWFGPYVVRSAYYNATYPL